MKTTFPCLVAVLMSVTWAQHAKAVAPTAEEAAEAARWAEARFEAPKDGAESQPFFSFVYDGKPSTEFLKTCEVKRASRKLDEKRTEHSLTWTDPKTGLVVRCVGVAYNDYPCVEWTLCFKNTSGKDTPILSDIQSLDLRVQRKPGEGQNKGEYLLHHNTGSQTLPTDFQPHQTVLGPGKELILAGAGGRPTGDHLSYYNLETSSSEGLIIAIGWPGQLATKFSRDGANGLRIRSGHELTRFKLLPGEEVRTPLTALLFWKGDDWLRAQNLWRRWFIAHNIPKPGGKLPPTQWCGAAMADKGECMEYVTEALSIKCIDAYEALGLKPDFWWMDAGWYPCGGRWWNVGTWEFDKSRFPRGIRPVSDYLHGKGIRTIFWFEPERVTANTWLPNNHPEWVFGGKDGALVDLGNPEAWKWIVERVDGFLVSEAIDIYRQDFNMDPLPYWRANDAPDRQGIAEIRHVTGLLAYWDELLRRHPKMLYDNCAGGGRRNDLESMRRGVPYTKSDHAVDPVGVQGETYGISMWLPYYAASWGLASDPYTCRSNTAHVIGAVPKPGNKDYGKQLTQRLDEWRKIAAHYWGDFWPLTPYSLDNRQWIAWQFDEPEKGEGVVQAFRRADSDVESVRLTLRGLDVDATYVLTNLDERGSTEMSGRELAEKGLAIALGQKPAAAVITYKKKP
jgi:alpha-galactosidase